MPAFIEKVEKLKMLYRLLILLGTLVAFAAFFIFVIYYPLTGEIKTVQNKIRALDKKINEAKIREKNLAKFEAQQAEVEEQFKEALKLLPNESEIPNLLRNITSLGTDSGLEFVLFKPQKERLEGFYYEIPVAIQVVGSYHNVALFFDRVGRMDRIVNINQVSMRPKGALSTTLTTNCNAVTYRFKSKTSDDDEKGKKKKKKKPKRKKKK